MKEMNLKVKTDRAREMKISANKQECSNCGGHLDPSHVLAAWEEVGINPESLLGTQIEDIALYCYNYDSDTGLCPGVERWGTVKEICYWERRG